MRCNIISLDVLDDKENVYAQIKEQTDRDPEEVLDDASWLFDLSGISIDDHEAIFEACIDAAGEVLGVSAVGLYDKQPDGGDLLKRPRYTFAIAVQEGVRRQGIARTLIQSLLRAYPREEVLLEGKVVSPHMPKLLKELGFYYETEPDDDEWSAHDLRWGRRMYRPR